MCWVERPAERPKVSAAATAIRPNRTGEEKPPPVPLISLFFPNGGR
jgi:hypothetical protein